MRYIILAGLLLAVMVLLAACGPRQVTPPPSHTWDTTITVSQDDAAGTIITTTQTLHVAVQQLDADGNPTLAITQQHASQASNINGVLTEVDSTQPGSDLGNLGILQAQPFTLTLGAENTVTAADGLDPLLTTMLHSPADTETTASFPAIHTSIAQSVMPLLTLPTARLKPGAEWQHTAHSSAGLFNITQNLTYTIREETPNEIVIEVTGRAVSSPANSQAAAALITPNGSSHALHNTALDASGPISGTITVDLATRWPSAYHLTYTLTGAALLDMDSAADAEARAPLIIDIDSR